jgi:hypothetical protein
MGTADAYGSILSGEIILVPDLPDDHVGSLVDLISLTAMDECDFTRIMIDVISDIQEHADIDEAVSIQNTDWKKRPCSIDAPVLMLFRRLKALRKESSWMILPSKRILPQKRTPRSCK